MRVILFQPRFHQLILDGVKLSTIRDTARCMEGDVLSLRKWTGLPYRSRQAVLRDVVCESVALVTVTLGEITWGGQWRDGEEIARTEGFRDWYEMAQWFNDYKTLPYVGWLIQWGKT